MKCLVKAATVAVWGTWAAIIANGFFGCGGGGGDAAPAATPTNSTSSASCAVDIGGDFFLIINGDYSAPVPIEDAAVEDPAEEDTTARIVGKVAGIVVNTNMCSEQTSTQTETTTTTTTETNEVQP